MEVQENKDDSTDFLRWLRLCIVHKDNIKTPEGHTIDKDSFITKDGFNNRGFNDFLYTVFKQLNK